MWVVLADDFSGAAEIGAIGHDKGLKTLICHEVMDDPEYDLIVINSGTRSLPESEAIKRCYFIANQLKSSVNIEYLFKKVDSVLRGHIIPEINVLHLVLGYDKIYLLPANPSKNRKIIHGQYFVNNQLLSKTSIAQDPVFPIPFSEISLMSKFEKSLLKHYHLDADTEIPATGLITADIAEKEDFDRFVGQISSSTLCCGAADFFSRILASQQTPPQNPGLDYAPKRTYQIVINGSAFQDQQAINRFLKTDTTIFSLPGKMKSDQFQLNDQEFYQWQQKVLTTLLNQKSISVDIRHPVIQNRQVSTLLLQYLADLVVFILEKIPKGQVHFWITGGETASHLAKVLNIDKLVILEQSAPGNVTLTDEKSSVIRLTTKPGSYAWSPKLFQYITEKESDASN